MMILILHDFVCLLNNNITLFLFFTLHGFDSDYTLTKYTYSRVVKGREREKSMAAEQNSNSASPPIKHVECKPEVPGMDYGLRESFVGISGIIGAGKSTLAKALGAELGLPVFYENVTTSPYLADFYKDQAKYAFPLQVSLLNQRFRQQQQIIWGGGGVQDRTIYEDTVFAKMLRDTGKMSDKDYHNYVDLFANMSSFMRKPTMIVYLDVKPEESLRRIKMRGREMEANIPIEYLRDLYDAYEDFIQNISQSIPVIRVDYATFHTAKEMAMSISAEYKKIHIIRNVAWTMSTTP
jgi:deoxyadenosine kinase